MEIDFFDENCQSRTKAAKFGLCSDRILFTTFSTNLSLDIRSNKNRSKAISKLAKIHAKVSSIRKDAIHKLSYDFDKNHSVIKLEDLSIKAFLKNYKLAGAIADCGVYEFKRQLEYKTEKFSSQLVL